MYTSIWACLNMHTHETDFIPQCVEQNLIGLPSFAKSDFLDSKRPELSKMGQNDRFELRKCDFAKSGKPMKSHIDATHSANSAVMI